MIGELSRKDAAEKFAELSKSNFQNILVSKENEKLRNDVLEFSDSFIMQSTNMNKLSYKYDLYLALYFYKKINEIYNFSEREAAQDDKWRYISLVILPDLVYKRWGDKESRFYDHSTRMYFKSLWWYIHLSWQGSESKTLEILQDNTTDHVSQLVERAGNYGYRITLLREIMHYYGEIEELPIGVSDRTNLFRKIMKLNTAWVKTMEPSLHFDGVKGYVKELFDYFGKDNNKTIKSS